MYMYIHKCAQAYIHVSGVYHKISGRQSDPALDSHWVHPIQKLDELHNGPRSFPSSPVVYLDGICGIQISYMCIL